MSSKIEQLIDDIEDFIDQCKFKPLSSTHIIVDKGQIDGLLRELRVKTPDEIKRYQKIISNKEAILADAREKAANLINEATVQTNALINEHEIMQQAYAQANEVVTLASNQAQEILDTATIEANTMREAAMQYTDDMLANVENIIAQAMEGAAFRYEQLMTGLNNCYDTVKANRAELFPMAGLEDLDDDSTEPKTLDVI
ncbi:MAG: ATPase [Lachnospiraceae bacterium]|nr:ATPase [Lachnospiraceae bacterium]